MTKEKMKEEIGEEARNIVRTEIHHNLCLTIEKALGEEPELIMDAENYELNRKEQNKDVESVDDWTEPEVYEFWAVSDWLYNKLKEKGEIVFEYLDFLVWGRQATGQAIYMDNVMEEIAKDAFRLE